MKNLRRTDNGRGGRIGSESWEQRTLALGPLLLLGGLIQRVNTILE